MLPVDLQRHFDRGRRLAPLTTWRIGGPAEYFCEPKSVDELVLVVGEMRRVGLPYRVLGGGSNLLVSDAGVRGVVLSLRRLHAIEARGERLIVEAGAALHSVVRFAASAGLSGAECLAGIPGHVGGAVFGNAGGKYGDIGTLVRKLTLLGGDGGVEEIRPPDGFFRYRGSATGRRIVLRAELLLTPGEPATIRRRNLDVIRERRGSQPGWIGNAGCVFRNPEGASAGRLIDGAGCKQLREGGLFVSERHANFFENDGTGNADQVHRLVDAVRRRVDRVYGVELEMEVREWA